MQAIRIFSLFRWGKRKATLGLFCFRHGRVAKSNHDGGSFLPGKAKISFATFPYFFFGCVLFAHFSWPSFVLLVKLEFLIKISVGRGSRLTWDIQASPRARCSSMAMDLSRNFHIFSPIFVYAWSLISWAWKIWLTQSDIYIMLTGGEWGESNSYFFSFLF